jgi:hypothetical protein
MSSPTRSIRTVFELREVVEAECRPLRDAVEGLDAAEFDRHTRAGWTVKEMLAHVAFWEETAEPLVRSFRGEPPVPLEAWYHGDSQAYLRDVASDWPPAMVHNMREAAWARDRTPAEVMARWNAAHARVLEIIDGLTDEDVGDERLVANLLACCSNHYQEHLSELLGSP